MAVREEELMSRLGGASSSSSSQAVKPVTSHTWQGEEGTTETAHFREEEPQEEQ